MSFIQKYRDHRVMHGILYGARLGAAALVVYAVLIFMELSLLKGSSWQGWSKFPGLSISGVIIMLTSAVLIKVFKWQTTWVIMLSGVLGAVLFPLIG
jgi:chromate transport protein ChrA